MSALEEQMTAEAGRGAPGQRARRMRPPMHCTWGPTESCTRNGKITSLSPAGCFVMTKAEAGDNQSLFVNCWLPTERWLLLRARVNYRLPKIGLGLFFVDLTDTEREMLATLLEFFDDEKDQTET